MTLDHDPMAALAADPAGPAAAPLRDRIAVAIAHLYRTQHGVHDDHAGVARRAASEAISMVAEAAIASSTTPPLSISQVDALRLLHARLAGEDSPLGRAAYAILRFHYVLPGPGVAEPGCGFCGGAGRANVDDLDSRHCHCRCDCCACGDALCDGPCDTLCVLLEELVLNGVPAGAVDVPRALAKLHTAAVRRIATSAITARLGHNGDRYVLAVDPDPDAEQPDGALILHVNSGGNSLAVEPALAGHGYRCEVLPRHELFAALYGVRIRVRPPAEKPAAG